MNISSTYLSQRVSARYEAEGAIGRLSLGRVVIRLYSGSNVGIFKRSLNCVTVSSSVLKARFKAVIKSRMNTVE